MKNTAGTKSSFHKLYLIDAEMYDRILPNLNEVDKQELNDLNENNRQFEDQSDDVPEHEVQEVNQEVNQEDDQANNQNAATSSSQNNTDKPAEMVAKVYSPQRMKKFACEICANKRFTTKQSLKRHNKTFHQEKQPLKEEEIYPDVKYPEIEKKASFEQDAQLKNLKRKFQEESEEEDEPAPKLKRYTSLPDIEVQQQKGIKRKGPKRATDYMPRKKFHWESYT